MQHLTVCVFLFICLRLLMSLTVASRPAMGASNRTYFICKALIGFCHYSIIAHLRAFIHYSLSQYPLFFDCLKRNSFLSNDKKLFLLRHYSFQFRSVTIISWKENFFPRQEVISIAIKPILLYQKCILPYRELSSLAVKCFLLHTKAFIVRTNPILLAWKSFLLYTKCLSLKPYIACLSQTVFCLSDTDFGQVVFCFCSSRIHFAASEIHFTRIQKHVGASRKHFVGMIIFFGASKKYFGRSKIQLLSSQIAPFTSEKVSCLENLQSLQEIKRSLTLNRIPYGERIDYLFTL